MMSPFFKANFTLSILECWSSYFTPVRFRVLVITTPELKPAKGKVTILKISLHST